MREEPEWKVLDEERERGILTTADREFLAGKRDLTDQSARDARFRIRKRLKNGIRDLAFAQYFLEDRDRLPISEDLFSKDDFAKANISRPISLFFQIVRDQIDEVKDASEAFSQIVEIGIRTAIRDSLESPEEYIININVDIQADYYRPDIDALLEKYENNEESLKELTFLREEDEIKNDERFFTHLLQRYWDSNRIFAVPSDEDGMQVFDPDEYDAQEYFVEQGVEAARKTNMIAADE